MSEFTSTQKRDMAALVLAFLQHFEFDRSYKIVLDEVAEKIPSLELSSDFLQQRHAAPILNSFNAHILFAGRLHLRPRQQRHHEITNCGIVLWATKIYCEMVNLTAFFLSKQRSSNCYDGETGQIHGC